MNRAQVSIDFLVALMLFFVIVGSLAPIAQDMFRDNTNTGLRFKAKSAALKLVSITTAKKIMDVPNVDESRIVAVMPDLRSIYYTKNTCSIQINPGSVSVNVLTESGLRGESIDTINEIIATPISIGAYSAVGCAKTTLVVS